MLSRLPALIWTLSLMAAVGLCFVPLFNLIGLESALVMGVIGGIAAILLTEHALSTGVVAPLHVASTTVSPTVDFVRLLPRQLLLLAPPFLILGLNALRVRNCDPVTGIVFWALIPVISMTVGQALVWFSGAWLSRRSWRLGFAFGVVVVDAVWMGVRLAFQPSIMGHSLLLGWFPGSLYDEAIHVPSALLWYRLLCVLLVAAMVLAVEVRWRRQSGRWSRPAEVGLAVVAVVCIAAWGVRKEMGLHLDRQDVVAELGATVESEHFIIHYEPGKFDAARLALLIEDHEFRYAELLELTGVDPMRWKGRRLRSYVYPDRTTQYRLMGSRRTLVARPWTHEMHIRWEQYGDSVLAHELAHLFSAPFGAGLSRLAKRSGILGVDLGLVEGFAAAADWAPDELHPHLASAAMRRLKIAPDLRRMFRPEGFWTQPSGKAYTMMGSFVRWLIDERGMDAFKTLYGSGDWEGVYGASAVRLVDDWESWLDTIGVDDKALELARYRYNRGSIFDKVCARSLAELTRRAEVAEASQDFAAAREYRAEVLSHEPKNPKHALAMARLSNLQGDASGALTILDELMLRSGLSEVLRSRVKELRGDVLWRADQHRAALPEYTECLESGVAESTRRRLHVKRQVLENHADVVLPLARRYLIEKSSPALALHLASRWRARAPDDPLAAYLEGLQLVRLGEYADAADALSGPPALLSEEVLDEQRRALLVISLMRLGRLDAADSILDGLLLSDNASKRLWAEEYRARVSFLRDYSGFEPWVPRGPPR